jgi:hypothetical protein
MKWENDPIGKDCIDLNITLAKWLSIRLQFLAENTHGWPHLNDNEGEFDRQFRNWKYELADTAMALRDYADADGNFDTEHEIRTERVQKAVQWVADNFTNLWD